MRRYLESVLAPLFRMQPSLRLYRASLDIQSRYIVSQVARFPQGAVANRIAEVGESQVCTSIAVAAELRYGAVRPASRKAL